jgi:hypothetical protein
MVANVAYYTFQNYSCKKFYIICGCYKQFTPITYDRRQTGSHGRQDIAGKDAKGGLQKRITQAKIAA